MKIENLKKGQVFKNYKSLCQVLEIEVMKNTNSKIAQFKDLATFCKYTKSGHQITIIELAV